MAPSLLPSSYARACHESLERRGHGPHAADPRGGARLSISDIADGPCGRTNTPSIIHLHLCVRVIHVHHVYRYLRNHSTDALNAPSLPALTLGSDCAGTHADQYRHPTTNRSTVHAPGRHAPRSRACILPSMSSRTRARTCRRPRSRLRPSVPRGGTASRPCSC